MQINCAQCLPGTNRTLLDIFPMVMNKGHAFALALCERRVLSDVRIIGIIVVEDALSWCPAIRLLSIVSFDVSRGGLKVMIPAYSAPNPLSIAQSKSFPLSNCKSFQEPISCLEQV